MLVLKDSEAYKGHSREVLESYDFFWVSIPIIERDCGFDFDAQRVKTTFEFKLCERPKQYSSVFSVMIARLFDFGLPLVGLYSMKTSLDWSQR